MQSTETLNDGLRRGYDITLATDELEAKVLERLETMRPNAQIRGFRKGKVPIAILRRNYGTAVLAEVRRDAIQTAITKHFEDSGDKPVRTPGVDVNEDEWAKGADIRLSLTYECKPEMPELDFSSIELEKPILDVDEDIISRTVQELAENASTFEAAEEGTKAEKGHQLVINLSGTVDGEPFEQGSATDFPLVLGSESFLPGFEEQLVGAAAGDSLEVEIRLPENFGVDEVAGKDAVFRCDVSAVRNRKIPPVDDELAAYYGHGDLEEMRAKTKSVIEENFGQASRELLKRRLLDALDSRLDFELPPSMLEEEAQRIASTIGIAGESAEGAEPEEGADGGNPTPTDGHRRLAARRVRLALFLIETANRAGISVSENDLYRVSERRGLFRAIHPQQWRKLVAEDSQFRANLTNEAIEEKSVDYIFELAKITEKLVPEDEFDQLDKQLEDVGVEQS